MREYKVKLALLEQLSDGEFHSGEKLGSSFNISRAAVSKHIKGIQNWGLDVFSVQGKGYRLSQPLNLLNLERIQKGYKEPIQLIPIIDSTNQYLLDRCDELTSGTVCIAEYQSNGRGRRGREWVSPFGSNLYLSMFWKLEAGMAAAMGLSLVAGIAIVEALESLGIEGVKLKWPNDLYYQDKKLAGILVELSGQAGGAAHIVLGLGMNLTMSGQQLGITQPWVSLSEISPLLKDKRNETASAFIHAWHSALEEYERNGMDKFVTRWNRLDNYLGRDIKLLMGNRTVEGIARGINEQGGVLIETESGLQSYIGGEISLRGN